MAQAYFPLLINMALFGMEPIEFKGGRLTTAWKRKGPQSSCASYRSLLVSSHAGKACHRTLRDLHTNAYERALEPDQLGGRKGMPVTLAMHVIRAHQRRCKTDNMASGVVFLDLREAFYRTLRELAIGSQPSPQLGEWLNGLELPLDTMDHLRQALKEPSAIAQAGFSQCHQAMVQALHQATWFTIPGQRDKVLTSIGSRPGDCFADWVFNMLFGRMLADLRDRLHHMSLLDEIPESSGRGIENTSNRSSKHVLLGPAWMDDLAIPVSATSANQLIAKVSKVLSELLSPTLLWERQRWSSISKERERRNGENVSSTRVDTHSWRL